MICYRCGFNMVNRIDSGWKGETDRPYGIYMCIKCNRIFVKFDDEL